MRTKRILCLVGLIAISGITRAEDSKKAEPAGDKKSAEVHVVAAEDLQITVKLQGTFAATRSAEIVFQPEGSTALKVERVVAQGTRVSKGEPIIWLDSQALDDQIAALETSQELSALALEDAELGLAEMEKTIPLDLAALRRAQKQAEEDLLDFIKVRRPQEEEQVKRSVESAQFSLEYAEEELKQLEKMYKADDLTEETEEIILKRTQRAVDSARYYLGIAKTSAERKLEVLIPRQAIAEEEAVRRIDATTAKSEITLPNNLKRERLKVAKARVDHEKSAEELKKLRADRKLMTVKAPMDGIVFYGAFSGGKWATASSLSQKLRPGGTLAANEVVMTIADPALLHVVATASEKQLNDLRPGLPVNVVPTAANSLVLAGKVSAVSRILDPQGAFTVEVQVAGKTPGNLTPGMTCDVSVDAYSKKAALTIPEKMLITKNGQHFVKIVGQQKPRPVTVGRRVDDKVEIVKGLKVGDKVEVGDES